MPSNRGSAGETSSHDSQRRQDSHDLPLPTPLTPGQTRGRAPPTTSVSTATAAMAPSGLAAVTIPDDPSPRTLPDDLQQSTQAGPAVSDGGKKKKKNRHRKRRNRRQSFLAPEGSGGPVPEVTNRSSEHISRASPEQHPNHAPFYRGRNLSSTSLESEALLDHRDQPMMRPRRDSRLSQPFRSGSYSRAGSFFGGVAEGLTPSGHRSGLRYQQHRSDSDNIEEDDEESGPDVNDRTPLITTYQTSSPTRINYGTDARTSSYASRPRRPSMETSSTRLAMSFKHSPAGGPLPDRDYDVNNPPSVPGSPKTGAVDMGYDDAMVTGIELPPGTRSPGARRGSMDLLRDAVIDMEGRIEGHSPHDEGSTPPSPEMPPQDALLRRRTIALPVEEDVCFPSELAEDYQPRSSRDEDAAERRRRRRREWPDLEVLEEWSREEKEDRSLEYRVKKISEPVLVGGRLRPQYAKWHREEEDAPYRFTYFNDDFQSTIHAQTISELVQPGGGFRELFIPEPPELEQTSSDEEEDLISLQESGVNNQANYTNHHPNLNNGQDFSGSRGPGTPGRSGFNSQRDSRLLSSQMDVRSDTDASFLQQASGQSKPKRYGPRPTWWLDVLCPTDPEMRIIAKAFGIHALTAEDIMMQEAREKVELFRNYYFLNYRTFEQDPNSENYLEPVNMYVVVFRDGCLSFHFSQTPHPANVRRRIRQLRDYLILSSDWISYALIDDITDVFGPLIQSIEDEVDEVDDTIMQMHALNDTTKESPGEKNNYNNKKGDDAASMTSISPGDMLRRVGDCRKKVMGMYRLLNTKADVIKGFAKRCNEQWEVAPKSEIGLYLGDIQDHIMTMTSNLTHYETLLSRAHSNYLAQINILMNERQEQTADVLGRLTVLGTIVLPMNIICGMWGMNVKVPGQDIESLYWFWSITGGLVLFGVASFLIAKRVYRIV